MRPFALAALCACSAGTALNRLPRTQIDRPYTVPAGVDDWSVMASTVASRDDARAYDATLSITPRWGFSITDDWELTLGPPIGVSHQFLHDDRHRLGATFTLNSGLSVAGGTDMPTRVDLRVDPALHVEDQFRLSRRWAWGVGISADASRWTYQPRWDWEAQFATGPLWQATDDLELEALIATGFLHDSLTDRPFVSVLVGGAWNIARQWEIGLRIAGARVGNANGYRDLNGTLTVVNFW